MNSNNEVIWAWVNAPGLDQPVERIAFINGTPRQRQVFHADGLGSIATLTDESGAIVQTYSYAAFGSIRTQTGTDLNRVTFTAREALGDTLGFYYYRNRIYDPNTGRFISEDPWGFVDGANRYIYCVNNPLLLLDPYGRQKDDFCQKADIFLKGVANGDFAEYSKNLPGDHWVKDIPWSINLDPISMGMYAISITYMICGFEYTIPSYEEYYSYSLGPK